MYQINDYRGTGRTTRLLALCREENAAFIAKSHKARIFADYKGYNDVEVLTYDEVLERGLTSNKKYVIDDLEYFAQSIIGGQMIGYSVEKPLPPIVNSLLCPKD